MPVQKLHQHRQNHATQAFVKMMKAQVNFCCSPSETFSGSSSSSSLSLDPGEDGDSQPESWTLYEHLPNVQKMDLPWLTEGNPLPKTIKCHLLTQVLNAKKLIGSCHLSCENIVDLQQSLDAIEADSTVGSEDEIPLHQRIPF